MLRTKQLGTFAQCARSFYIGGSRWSTVDGASYPGSEEEPSVSKRQTAGHVEKNNAYSAHGQPAYTENTIEPVSCRAPVYMPATSTRQIVSSISTPGVNIISGNQSSYPPSSHIPSKIAVESGTGSPIPEIVRGHARKTSVTCIDHPQQQPSNDRPSGSKSRGKASRGPPSSFYGSKNGGDLRGSSYARVDRTSSGTPTHASTQHHSGFHSDSGATSRMKDAAMQNVRSLDGTEVGCVGNPSNTKSAKKANKRGALSRIKSLSSVRAVEQYYHTLQQLKWGPSAENVLESLSFKLNVYQANEVLKLLRDHSVALGFFQWLKRQPGFRHDGHTYTTMIGILGQARQFGTMKKLVDEMTAVGCKPTIVTYNRLINSYGRANYIEEAVQVLREMQQSGHKPDLVTYCTLIDIHAKAGFFDVALGLYNDMQDAGLSPDTYTYSVMVNCLGKGGHLTDAYKLFCEMVDNGCVPNIVTYNTIIKLQSNARNYDNVVKLYKNMQASGFRPDRITYSIVMEALGHCGHLDEAEAVFVQMRHDCVPDEPAYGLLVDLWGKAGNVEKAQAWYRAMLKDGLQPNVPTSNSLLSAFLKMHRFSDAYNFLRSMLSLGLVPSSQTYTLLLSSCTATRTNMGLCGELMAITGHPAHMFLLCLPYAEPGGRNVMEHAGCFLDMMHSEDRESKRGLMDAVIDFLHKSSLKEEAGLIWEVTAQRNVYPDSVREKSSSYWLINLHLMSEGTAVVALSRTLAWFQRQMLCHGAAPERIDIVTGWGRRSRVTGSSLVRQSVQKLLNLFGFPFASSCGNSGCFVGTGNPLSQWLLNPYIERMHLL